MTIPYQNIKGIAAPINGIDPGLFPFYIDEDVIFEQYLPQAPFNLLMGKDPSNPIVLRKVTGGKGFQVRASQVQMIDYTNPVTDYNQVRGQAQKIQTNYDYYNLGKASYPVNLEGDELTSIGTPMEEEVKNRIVGQIVEACALGLNKAILDSATWGNYPNTDTMKPSYDRIILAGVAPDRGDYNAYAGIDEALSTMVTGPAYNQNGLSASVIMKATSMARQGGNLDGVVWSQGVTIENKIRPAKLQTYGGWPARKYLGFFSPTAVEALQFDTLFQATATARGTTVSSSQPEMISGADYVGEYQGMYIHTVDDLAQYTITVDGVKYAWGFLVGAAAWEVAWGRYPYVVSDNDVIDDVMIWTSHEIRGQKALRYPAKQINQPNQATAATVVEQGIVHIFTRLP